MVDVWERGNKGEQMGAAGRKMKYELKIIHGEHYEPAGSGGRARLFLIWSGFKNVDSEK